MYILFFLKYITDVRRTCISYVFITLSLGKEHSPNKEWKNSGGTIIVDVEYIFYFNSHFLLCKIIKIYFLCNLTNRMK